MRLPGFDFASASSSRTELAGSFALVTRISHDDMSCETGTRSFAGSNGSLRYKLGPMARPAGVSSTVVPSGADFATTSAPMLLPAPGRFSTMTGCAKPSLSLGEKARAIVSTAPPAANGTTMRSSLPGNACAHARPDIVASASNASHRFMIASSEFLIFL